MMELWFSQSESALVMGAKSNGKPISSWTDLGPDLQMRLTLDRGRTGTPLRSADNGRGSEYSGVQAARRSYR